MKRSKALLAWMLPVVWVAGNEPEAAPPPVVIHYHLHIGAGADAEAILRQVAELSGRRSLEQ